MRCKVKNMTCGIVKTAEFELQRGEEKKLPWTPKVKSYVRHKYLKLLELVDNKKESPE